MQSITAVSHAGTQPVQCTKGVWHIFRSLASCTTSLASISIFAITCLQAHGQESALTANEKQLADLVNQYRQQENLPAVPVTNSLTKVARTHVKDLDTNHPDTATYGTGSCNRHSWSDKGVWTAVCYTGSSEASKMWSKPGEITTTYRSSGYEIAFVCVNCQATPAAAVNEWKGSTDHSDTILERGIFSIVDSWQAMGVAIDGSYAVVWFGQETDPAGVVPSTGTTTTGGSTGLAGLTLDVDKAEYPKGEAVKLALKNKSARTVDLAGCYYIVQKLDQADGQWKRYNRLHLSFKTPAIETGQGKGFEWDQLHEDGHVANPGRFRINLYIPSLSQEPLTTEFRVK
ncbi:MAG: CAP domain-containing protein [Acidobacteriota bacterium]